MSFYFTKLYLLYALSHFGVFFLIDAIYWDDWAYHGAKAESILDAGKQSGGFFNFFGYILVCLQYFGPWISKVLTFFLMFGAGFALDQIIKKYKSINDETRFVIVLFFLILPFYWSRIAQIMFVYTFCYFLFFLAWAINERSRFISMFLFFISFNTNSLLIFFLIPYFDIYFRNNSQFYSIKSIIKFSLYRFELTLLPFTYFGLKIYFFSPYDSYEGYNEQYNISVLYQNFQLMFNEWYDWYTWYIPNHDIMIYFYISICICLFYIYIFERDLVQKVGFRDNLISIILIGILIFIIAGIPYLILDKIPRFNDWYSRHQILLPLGASIVILAFISLLPKQLKSLAIVSVIAFSTINNLSIYKELYIDWQKQKVIMNLIANNDDIKKSDILIFEDLTRPLNAMNRGYRKYEWNGLVATALGDETRFSVNKFQFPLFLKSPSFKLTYKNRDKFKASNFKIKKVHIPIHVKITNISKGPINFLREFAGIKLSLKVTKLPPFSFN